MSVGSAPTNVCDSCDTLNVGSTGLQMTGSLVVTTCDIDVETCDSLLEIQQLECDRAGNYVVATPTYYIKHEININQYIDKNIGTNDSQNGDPDEGNDDAWRINDTVTVTDEPIANRYDILLPVGTADYNIATITVCDELGSTCDYAVTMTVSSGTDGTLSTGFTYEDVGTFIGVINDRIEDAQFAYWTEGNKPSPGPNENDADRLAALLQNSDLTNHYATAQASFCDEIDGKNLIHTYSMTLNEETEFSTTSSLSKLAANRDINDTNVFNQGDQIVLATPHPLQYGLGGSAGTDDRNDFQWDNSTATTVNVYGILVQSAVPEA